MHKRREHLPSPVKQRILWSSPLKGMERPVRSFKSFIRTVPPNPGIESQKPLPPIPSSPNSPDEVSIDSPIIPLPKNSTKFAPWQAPTQWEWDLSPSHTRPINTTSIFPNRNYHPLLPEASRAPFNPKSEMFTGIVDTGDAQRGPFYAGFKAMEDKPVPPPRNPSRLSMSGKISGRSGSDSSASSVPSDHQSSLSPSFHSETRQDQPSTSHLHSDNDTPNVGQASYRVSDASTKAKAFASLGIGSPRNSKDVWQGWTWTNRSDASQADEVGPHPLILRGKDLQPLVGNDLSASKEVHMLGLEDKLQQLSFSQDYHDVLAHQYHETYIQPAEVPKYQTSGRITPRSKFGVQAQFPQREHEMIPRPLAWRKSSGSSSSSSCSKRRPVDAEPVTTSRPRKMHKKVPSWVPLQHLYVSETRLATSEDAPSHSTRGMDIPRSSRTGMTKNLSPKKPHRFPNLMAHARGLRSHKHHSGPDDPTTIAANSPQRSVRPPRSHTPAHPSRPTVPLLRLPGGLALVRNPPSETLRPEASNMSHPSPFIDTWHNWPHTDSPFPPSSGYRRPSSAYSQSLAASPVAPGIAINNRMRSSISSLPSSRPYSSNASLPSSPLAQELFLPRTPPPLPTKQPRVSPTVSPLSTSSGRRYLESFFEDDTADNNPYKPGLFDKARDVRDAWKRQQKEAKQEKLKQSIRVLGPLDVTGVNRRSNREASVLVDSKYNWRKPGAEYMASNFI
ncbi:hypothetical protein T440DRAFT_183559 [Plenodomus tracheiphilus IPT5]|uniref:Uncharacterized protein n=1 Tax=Plenodomus tracheiphilus IPT5 TaxID=1408161 RepID=A0A6A7AYF9_9PLEO|nr:hypothetical protein T440DRAFT_183559 [Plenodomus tracheiphilus IPT5]